MQLGIDLVRISDVRAAFERHGQAYLRRVFTSTEVADCRARGAGFVESLAARFAAKEAVAKALDVGDEALDPRDVEVVRMPSGACRLALHGAASRLARRGRLSGWAVSLTHEGDYAAAVVLATRGATPARRSPRPPRRARP